MRLSVVVLGFPLLLVDTSESGPVAPAVAPPPPKPAQPEGEASGPITDRQSAPITQIGFRVRSRWADGRDQW